MLQVQSIFVLWNNKNIYREEVQIQLFGINYPRFHMNGEELYLKLSGLIMKAEIEEALRIGYEYYPDKQFILLSNRYFRIRREWNKGIITHEVLQLEVNRISDSILEVSKNIDKRKNYRGSKLRRWRIIIGLLITYFLDYSKIKITLIYIFSGVTAVTGITIYSSITSSDQNEKNREISSAIELKDSLSKEQEKKIELDSLSGEKLNEIQSPPIVIEYPSEERKKVDSSKADKAEILEEIRVFGKTWTARPINIKTKDSWCPNNKSSECRKYGGLYNWKEAQSVCELIGKNWYLPSNNDLKSLLDNLGGINDPFGEGNGNQSKTFNELESRGIKILFPGSQLEGVFNRFNEVGYYWSSTTDENDESKAWVYSFEKKTQIIERYTDLKSYGYSCFCIKK